MEGSEGDLSQPISVSAVENVFRPTWRAGEEVLLFSAIMDEQHKPVGVNRHFQMMCILEKLWESETLKNIPATEVWEHLDSLFDLPALNDSEVIPFPNKESDFFLPEGEFGQLMHKKDEDLDKGKSRPATATPSGAQSLFSPPSASSLLVHGSAESHPSSRSSTPAGRKTHK